MVARVVIPDSVQPLVARIQREIERRLGIGKCVLMADTPPLDGRCPNCHTEPFPTVDGVPDWQPCPLPRHLTLFGDIEHTCLCCETCREACRTAAEEPGTVIG